MRLRARWVMVFAVLRSVCGAEPDAAVVTAMRRAAGVEHVRVLQRTGVDADMDLVIAAGSRRRTAFASWPRGWWLGEEMPLGLFLQRRDRTDMVYRVVVDKGERDIDCSARLERVTSAEVVISCTPEKGRFGPMRKFVYDSRAKALVKQFDYSPYAMSRIFVAGERAVLVGTNYQRLIAVEYDPGRTPAFRILRGAEEELWTSRVPTSTGTVGIEMRREIYIEPEPFKEIRFGSDRRFALVKGGLVTEKTARGAIRYPLPQSTYDEFAAARPGRVRDGYTRPGTIIEENIGPWQIEGDRLWFGKTFYDGEGNTGVGGFGYFDAVEKKYRIWSPPEIAGSSVSAILVEPATVWLALVWNGEYGATAGGLIAFHRRTEQIERFELQDVAQSIARVGEHLLIATEFGPAVLDGGRVRRFFVDETSDGRLYVEEPTAGDGSPQRDKPRER